MMREGMPGVLRERLGEAAAEGLIQFLNAREDYMTEAIAEAVGHTLEPRFAAIEAQLSQCVTKAEFEERSAQADARFAQIDRHFENIDKHFEYGDRRLDQFDGRLSRIEGGATAFEARVTTKLDAQFLAIDAKLSRAMYVQVSSITLFAGTFLFATAMLADGVARHAWVPAVPLMAGGAAMIVCAGLGVFGPAKSLN